MLWINRKVYLFFILGGIMDEFDFEENYSYIEEHLREALKGIGHKARNSFDNIQDDIFNYDYVDNLIYSVISGLIQLSFFVLVKKIYEKRYINNVGGIDND